MYNSVHWHLPQRSIPFLHTSEFFTVQYQRRIKFQKEIHRYSQQSTSSSGTVDAFFHLLITGHRIRRQTPLFRLYNYTRNFQICAVLFAQNNVHRMLGKIIKEIQGTSILDKVHIFREVLTYKYQIFIMVNNIIYTHCNLTIAAILRVCT